MFTRLMKLSPRRLGAVAALALAAASLGGCVYYPSGYGYGYGYSPGYYAAPPAYYAPPVSLYFGGGWGHRWR